MESNDIISELEQIYLYILAMRQTRSPGDFSPLEKWKLEEFGEFFFKKLLTFCGNHDNKLNKF